MAARKPAQESTIRDTVIQEFPSVGKYKVRILEGARKGGATTRVLDIREYVKAETFEGFTRRGIRLISAEQCEQLKNILEDVDAHGLLGEKKA